MSEYGLSNSGDRVARNLIKKYGADKFRTLVSMLEGNKTGPEIAEVFGVTRQRVSQWRSSLGITETQFILYTDVALILNACEEVDSAVG